MYVQKLASEAAKTLGKYCGMFISPQVYINTCMYVQALYMNGSALPCYCVVQVYYNDLECYEMHFYFYTTINTYHLYHLHKYLHVYVRFYEFLCICMNIYSYIQISKLAVFAFVCTNGRVLIFANKRIEFPVYLKFYGK